MADVRKMNFHDAVVAEPTVSPPYDFDEDAAVEAARKETCRPAPPEPG